MTAALRGLRRLWPDSIATRIAVILMLALFAFLAISMIAYVRDRAEATLKLFAHSTVGRMGAIVELFEATPAARRAALIPALDSPTLRVALARERPKLERADPEAERFVREHLGGLSARPLAISVPDHGWKPRRRWRERHEDTQPDLLPSRRKAVIAVGLDDGSWSVFTASTELTSLRWAARMAMWMVIGGIFVVLFAAWVSRRVSAPVRRFAEAADRIGRDAIAAAAMPETGSPELKRAARTFNQMQDRLRRLVDDRTQMLAAISHDMRTALTRLRLRIEFIGDDTQRARAEADLEEMRAMLEATLSFARDEAAEETRRPVDLASMLQTLCDGETDAGRAASYDGPDHLTLSCGAIAIRRALANLTDNAITYGGRADIALSETDELVVVTIGDRGPGIPASEREAVFAPFRRLETSRNRETGGTGLGLAIARAAVRRHGGDITLRDRRGGGLDVAVSLPKPKG